MINYRKLNNKDKNSRYFNVKSRCGKEYQDKNPRYYGVCMCKEWIDNKAAFYKWLDENYYEVNSEQMDVDKDIIEYGNKEYHPNFCLIVPHSINSFYETLEVGKTNITYSKKTKKYSVKVFNGKHCIRAKDLDNYNEALNAYCDIKQGILVSKAIALRDQIPDKVYKALMNTDIKAINVKHYDTVE